MVQKQFRQSQSLLTSALTILRHALALAAVFLGLLKAGATIDVTLQMQLGNPSGATVDTNNHNHFLLTRTVEAIDYSDNLGEPNWASWDLTAADIGSSGRTDAWASDTNLPPNFYLVPINPFSGSGYDRGHMCPSADRTDSVPDNELVFLMSNIIPQASLQNQGIWANFENYCRNTLLPGGKELLIICGPSLFTTNKLNNNHVTIPGYTWKIVVVAASGSGAATNRINATSQVIALRIPNTDAVGSDPWQDYVTNTVAIQNDTGFTFFTALPPNLATVLRNKIDGQTPPAPAITGFSPTSGTAGASVAITGTNFVFATNVTFNGTSAAFTIVSTTNITATVPINATSGHIAVATLGGTATTSSNFTVTTVSAADLAVLKSHTGSFTQGDTGDTYTIIVTNVGNAASSGSITVTDSLPAGLIATAISGTGWTTNLANLTCSRSDSLSAGAAYPPITLTVNVSGGAPASLTNVVTVSGGGETNVANNTASDPTTVLAAGPPTATTDAATGVGMTTATLNGTVNPNGQPTTAQFQYGLTTAYGSTSSVAGPLTGSTAQPVSANLTGLTSGMTYHFRVSATNLLGSANGQDQTFMTSATPTVDLAITKTHAGNFTQGDASDSYTIIVTNVGTAASSGSITVTDSLPAGLTATAISGSGWTPNLANLTCTRSDVLAAGAAYPAVTVTVSVAGNANASVTNLASVSGGGDVNSANNTASDPTTINASGGGGLTTLVGWDVSGQSNFGVSPMAPTTNAANLAIVGLTRGSGVGTSGTAAARAWGGNNWTNATSAAAIAANQFATFSLAANNGYKVSYSSISKFDYRHSATGATNGLLQYQIGSGAFTDIASFFYPSNTSGGGSLNPIDLSGVAALQNVGAGTNVTFRLVNWGGTSSAGTWYIFDVGSSSASDFAVQGTVSPTMASVADLAIFQTHSGSFTQADVGDTYTLTVTNLGAAATVGTVTMTDALPAGLTATAIGGSGWTGNLGTMTCTRSDALAAGASYPPITVTVNVATNAPASVTNTALVSGGGQTNTANDTASDPTAIIPLTPIQAWRLQWFGTTANSGVAADTYIGTSDGMENLLKYALGLNPLVATNNPVVGDISSGYLRLTSPKNPNATDVSFHVEVTGDLETPSWTSSGTTIDQNTATLLQAHWNTPVSTSAGGFIRLRVSRP